MRCPGHDGSFLILLTTEIKTCMELDMGNHDPGTSYTTNPIYLFGPLYCGRRVLQSKVPDAIYLSGFGYHRAATQRRTEPSLDARYHHMAASAIYPPWSLAECWLPRLSNIDKCTHFRKSHFQQPCRNHLNSPHARTSQSLIRPVSVPMPSSAKLPSRSSSSTGRPQESAVILPSGVFCVGQF